MEVRIGGPPRRREPDRAQPEVEHLVQPEAPRRARLVAEHLALRIGGRKPVRVCPARSRSEERPKRALTIEDLREQPGHKERVPANQARARP